MSGEKANKRWLVAYVTRFLCPDVHPVSEKLSHKSSHCYNSLKQQQIFILTWVRLRFIEVKCCTDIAVLAFKNRLRRQEGWCIDEPILPILYIPFSLFNKWLNISAQRQWSSLSVCIAHLSVLCVCLSSFGRFAYFSLQHCRKIHTTLFVCSLYLVCFATEGKPVDVLWSCAMSHVSTGIFNVCFCFDGECCDAY